MAFDNFLSLQVTGHVHCTALQCHFVVIWQHSSSLFLHKGADTGPFPWLMPCPTLLV